MRLGISNRPVAAEQHHPLYLTFANQLHCFMQSGPKILSELMRHAIAEYFVHDVGEILLEDSQITCLAMFDIAQGLTEHGICVTTK